MLILERINLTLGKGTALERPLFRDLNLTLGEGEFVTLVGDNGTGKSSLFNLIAGTLRPDAGRVRIGGQDMAPLNSQRRACLVSQVMQDPRVGTLANLTIEENMSFALKRGQNRTLWPALTRQRRDLFREKLRVLGMNLEDRMADPVGTLSGGQRQALSLIMATLRPAKVLLLDEITAALDPQAAATVLKIASLLAANGKMTTLMITHNAEEAFRLGTRTVRLAQGTLAEEGR